MLKHRLVLAVSLLPFCLACSGLQTRETPQGLSPNSIECSKKPDAQLCWRAFVQAAELRDRSSAGQTLMMFAQTQPLDTQQKWLALGMWLNPKPWKTNALKWSDETLEPLVPKNQTRAPILNLGASPKPANSESAPVIWGKLPKAPNDIDPEQLANLLAAASDSVGYIEPTNNQRLHVTSPALNHLTKLPIVLEQQQSKLAEEITKADALLAQGKYVQAHAKLQKLLEPMEESKQCDVRAPLLYAESILGHGLYNTSISKHKETLSEICASKKPKTPTEYLIRLVLDMEMGGDDENIVSQLSSKKMEAQFLGKVEAYKQHLSPKQKAFVDYLWQHVQQMRTIYPRLYCAEAEPLSRASIQSTIDASFKHARPYLSTYLEHQARIYFKGKGEQATIQRDEINTRVKRYQKYNLQWSLPTFYFDVLRMAPVEAPMMERLRLTPVCQTYLNILLEQQKVDVGQGMESRAKDRAMSWNELSNRCVDTQMYTTLLQQTVIKLQSSPRGHISFLEFFGHLSVVALAGIFDGKINDTLNIVKVMMPELQNLKKTLGKTGEDKILHDLIGTLEVLSVSRIDLVPGTLNKLSKTLDDVLSQPLNDKSSELVKQAPLLRLLTGHGLAIFTGMSNPKALPATIRKIELTLNKDLIAVLRDWEQPKALAGPIETHLKVAYQIALLATTQQSAYAKSLKSQLAKAQLTQSSKWWSVILKSIQSTGWGVLAYHYHGKKDGVARSAALLSSKQILGKLIEQALTDFNIQNTNWELLRLSVPVYEVIAKQLIQNTTTTKDVDWTAELFKTLPGVEAVAKSILKSLEQKANAQDDPRPNFVNLLMDLFKASFEVGLTNMYDAKTEDMPKAAREALALKMDKRLGPYSSELKVYAYTLKAVLLYDDDKASQTALNKAITIANQQQGSYIYLPLLVSLRMNRTGWSDPQKSLTRLQEVMRKEKSIKQQCSSQHTKALLPQEARLLDLKGKHKQAALKRLEFFKATDDQFVGEAILSCQIDASRGLVKANLNLSFPMTSLSFERAKDDSDDNLSTFQIGFGVGSIVDNSEKVRCTLVSPGGKQYARIYQAVLEQALMALYQRDNSNIQRALGRLIKMNTLFIDAQQGLLPRAMNALFTERTKLDLSMLRWVIVMAQSRGQWQTGKLLYEHYIKLLKLSEVPKEAGKTPKFVKQFKDLMQLEELVNAFTPSKTKDWKALVPMVQKNTSTVLKPEEKHLLLIATAGLEGKMDIAKAQFAAIKKIQKHNYQSLLFTLGFTLDSKNYDLGRDLQKALAALKKEQQFMEFGMFMNAIAKQMATIDGGLAFLAGIHKVWSDVPEWFYVRHVLGTTLLNFANKLPVKDTNRIFAQWLKDGFGITSWNSYVGLSYQNVGRLIQLKQYKDAQQQLTKLTSMMLRGYPYKRSVMVELLTIEMSLRIVLNKIDEEAINGFLKLTESAEKPEAKTLGILEKYRAAKSKEARLKIAKAHLKAK